MRFFFSGSAAKSISAVMILNNYLQFLSLSRKGKCKTLVSMHYLVIMLTILLRHTSTTSDVERKLEEQMVKIKQRHKTTLHQVP